MITFNIQARNGNYLRSHNSSNRHSNCWSGERGKEDEVLTLTLEQAREILKEPWLRHNCNIVLTLESEPLTDGQYQHELFCIRGGKWYDYKGEENAKC